MPLVEINDLDRHGVIRDVAGYMLPPEALTFGRNVRIQDGGVERIEGRSQIFGTPGVAPHFAMFVASNTQTYLLYTSLTKAYVWDGASHTDITRAAGDYTTTQTREWQGTLLGGIPILNNGVDDPQYWSALNPATDLIALANWPANTKTKIIRAFGPYLLALNVTKSATNFAHLVKWSHKADPGTLPNSWDHTDATKDAGEYELPDAHAGVLVDGGTLRDNFFAYKEGSVWRVSNISGQFIFRFDIFLETVGLMTQRCFAYTSDGLRHCFASHDDILVHNGNNAESILDRRMRRYVFNQINSSSYRNCFMFTNPYRDEIWFCFPTSGETNPNRALIWNYREGIAPGALTEVDIDFRNAVSGTIEGTAGDTWSTVVGTWDSYVGPWGTSKRRRTIVCTTDQTKFHLLDDGLTYGGTPFTATVQREGLAITGKKRNGEPIVDFASHKLVTRMWLKVEGGPIQVRVGYQEKVDGPTTWTVAQTFDPATQLYLDFSIGGKAIAVEFSSVASVAWKLYGYKLDVNVISEF